MSLESHTPAERAAVRHVLAEVLSSQEFDAVRGLLAKYPALPPLRVTLVNGRAFAIGASGKWRNGYGEAASIDLSAALDRIAALEAGR